MTDDNKEFTLFWRDGKREVLRGRNAADAMTRAGYGNGALPALDFHAAGNNESYTWNTGLRQWQSRP